jgi:hypothetical protein
VEGAETSGVFACVPLSTCACAADAMKARENVLFIGTQFSNLYTAVDTPAEAARCIVDMSPLTIVREH